MHQLRTALVVTCCLVSLWMVSCSPPDYQDDPDPGAAGSMQDGTVRALDLSSFAAIGEGATAEVQGGVDGASDGRALVWNYRKSKEPAVLVSTAPPNLRADDRGMTIRLFSRTVTTVSVSLKESGGGRWDRILQLVPGEWKAFRIPFGEFEAAEDAPDDNGRLDVAAVVNVMLIDVGGLVGQGEGPNTLLVDTIGVMGPTKTAGAGGGVGGGSGKGAKGPPPRLVEAFAAGPRLLAVVIEEGEIEFGRQVPYQRQPGDRVRDRCVYRDGKYVGVLVGKDAKIILLPDRYRGRPLNVDWAQSPESYAVVSADDPAFAQEIRPLRVHRKTRPTNYAIVGRFEDGAFEAPKEHRLYLELPTEMTPGKRYAVELHGGEPSGRLELEYRDEAYRSEAVHVSHLGFRPDDPAKVGFVSLWRGDGGRVAFSEGLPFRVVEDGSGRTVAEGETKLVRRAGEPGDARKRNYVKADVHLADFSDLRAPGTYRLCVAGIGSSLPFEIGPDVWRKAFYVSVRGLYHQRSGIELGPPYTSFRRPRSFHPDDGVVVYASSTPLAETGMGFDEELPEFAALLRGRTDEVVPDAWGGWMDAGDWDRRIQHVIACRYLVDLVDGFPETLGKVKLDLPESGNDLPDMIDEALWGLEVYRRMQTADGGIRGGIESAEHPNHGEASWQESLPVMAYAPGVWSSHLYAAAAARMAIWAGRNGREKLAKTYRESAVRAMEWAERHFDAAKHAAHHYRDARNLAAADLFELTGEKRWHDLFLATTVFRDPKAPLFEWQHHEQREAAWSYVRCRRQDVDREVRKNCYDAILREADEILYWQERAAFRWVKHPYAPFIGQTVPSVTLARAHWLSGEEKYLRGAVLSCQMGAGGNPIDMCYTTGLGHRSPRNPLHVDSRMTNQPPPPGLTLFGPRDVEDAKGDWPQQIVSRFCHPRADSWPTMEAFFDVYCYPAVLEFTIHQTIAPTFYVWGYLAARR